MPVMTLCCVIIAQMARMTRAAVLDQLNASYVEMAILKGASPMRVVLRHVLPNTIGPIANAVALSLSYLFGGVVIVESIFNYPGLASLMVDAVTNRDMPLVQGCVMVFCAGISGARADRRPVSNRIQPEACVNDESTRHPIPCR